MEKLGTEKIEAFVESVGELVKAGKIVAKDSKIGVEDLPVVVGLLPKLPKMLEDFKAVGEAFEEGKDLDVAEIIALIQKVHNKVKEIEQA
jgi:hypothetical protein